MELTQSQILKQSIRKEIDIKMSLVFENEKPKAILPINEDTTFDIFYDIYDADEAKYLYIKMQENTAIAPFFYNRSYELNELYDNHRIFKTCDTIEEVRDYIESLFQKNKIKLRYNEKDNEEIIIMEMDVVLFATPIKLKFELYREMVLGNDKDSKLIELYKINKMKLKELKKIFYLIQGNDKEQIKQLNKLFKSFEIPGIE